MSKERKLDLFGLLNQINVKQKDIVQQLTEDEQKEVQPLLIMRWMSGTNDARQVFLLNEVVNPYVFSLTKHKSLLIDLSTVCASGKSKRYTWIKAPTRKGTSNSLSIDVIVEFFGYSIGNAKQSLPLFSDDDVISYAEQLGWEADRVTKLKKELKTRHGN